MKSRKAFLLIAMLLGSGVASAQVVVKGNVYGGGEEGQVVRTTNTNSGNAKVTIYGGTMKGSVYGGGLGSIDDETRGAVLGNTWVDMRGGLVELSIYGGGELGSVGTFTCTPVTYSQGAHSGTEVLVPTSCASGTGVAKVTVSGGNVGKDGSKMPSTTNPGEDVYGWIFCGSQGEADSITFPKAIAVGVVDSTYLEISGSDPDNPPVVTASVYGGCENGLVLRNTKVKITGGQIGTGYNKATGLFDDAYSDDEWEDAIDAVNDGTIGTTYVNPFHECDAWPFGKQEGDEVKYYVYDIFADSSNHPNNIVGHPDYHTSSSEGGTNGHSFFGNVFGGGSGYYPIAPGVWRRGAGQVKGNTNVEITGGHILTCVYGGNENTDVGTYAADGITWVANGKATITMTGGTVGVPRDSASIANHPVTCYLFGAGMGDPRTMFNTWTNIHESEVSVTGGIVFGSVLGGGEEGHVLDKSQVTIGNDSHSNDTPIVGTLGYTYLDGNVFGGGRGFTGEALTAGSVGGNVTVNIKGGKMLGSVYGGGRLSSVGTYFVPPTSQYYGQLQPGGDHGRITVNISGGYVGNAHESIVNPGDHMKGGNVFGGGMGRIELLSGAENPRWPSVARAKWTKVNITGGTVKGNLYGGSEYGSVRDTSWVVLDNSNAMIHKIFGGGYGSTNIMWSTNDSTAYPAKLAGRVLGNSIVEIKSGTVQMSVYGGGEYASVGMQTSNGALIGGKSHVIVRGGTIGDDAMYVEDDGRYLDDTHTDHSGHVFGGGQGVEDDRTETYKLYCNVNNTKVTVEGGKIYGSVFGGGAESHVLGNDSVYIHTGADIGSIGTTSWDGNVFGGGKGNGYELITGEGDDADTTFVAFKSSGRVEGNTYIEMDGGSLKGSIFGGGRLGMLGVNVEGNYNNVNTKGKAVIKVSGTSSTTGGVTTYSTIIGIPDGVDLLKSDESVGDIFGSGKGDTEYYDDVWAGRVTNSEITVSGNPRIYGSVFGGGEMASIGYWETEGENAGTYKVGTGSATVTIGSLDENNQPTNDNPVIGTDYEFTMPSSGTGHVGNWTFYETINGVTRIAHTATGNVFGGCQGDVDAEAPHWVSMGRSRTATVNIYGGTIKGCVYGGGEQGSLAGNATVTMKGGTIGWGKDSQGDHRLTASDGSKYSFGSLYGGGYGTTILDVHETDSAEYTVGVHYAGRIYGNTFVNVSGGRIYDNIYGGGDLASVGIDSETIGGQHNDSLVDIVPHPGTGHCTVNISGTAYVGDFIEGSMHGFVFGGGKGVGNDAARTFNRYCNVNSTEVIANLAYSNDDNPNNDGHVGGSIFGGSPFGHVLDSTYVELQGGVIGTTGFSGDDGHLFGGGWGDKSNFYDDIPNKNYFLASGRVGGHTHVKMTGGQALGNLYGGGFVALTGVGVDGSFVTYIDTTAHPQVYDTLHHGTTRVEVTRGQVGNTVNDGLNLLLSDEKNGNVYGGGRGDLDDHVEDDFGRSANSVVYISGSPSIAGSVYGGGQEANSGHWNNYDDWYTDGTCATLVDIQGSPTIGTELEFNHDDYSTGTGANEPKYTRYDTINGMRMIVHTRTGNVYGGGQGNMVMRNGVPEGFEQGHCGQTEVRIGGSPTIMASVYGGSEQGAVWGNTKVTISGDGTIGTPRIKYDTLVNGSLASHYPNCDSTYSFGSVFGGSYGIDAYKHLGLPITTPVQTIDTINNSSGHVYGNTKVTIRGGQIYGNVFGGGDLASVGGFSKTLGGQSGDSLVALVPQDGTGFCEVIVSDSAIIGPLDYTGLNAYVFGGGNGVGNDPQNLYKTYCNVNSAAVTVNLNSSGRVYGSLFGGGSDAHTLGDVSVTLNDGLIGTDGTSSWDGNIFGGGRNYQRRNYTAGRVDGNTTIEMTNGQIKGSIYGGGRLALTGVDVNGALREGDNSVGNTKVMVKGGTVGNNTPTGNTLDPDETVIETFADFSMGSVYGGGKGHIDGIVGHPAASALLVAIVKNTEVEVSDTLGNNTHIYGIVYGGGEVSNVGDYRYQTSGNQIHNIDTVAGTGLAKVTISGGIIGGDRSQMRTTLMSSNPNDDIYWTLYNDDLGYVYGGGEGISDDPSHYDPVYEGSLQEEPTSLINLMGTVMHTQVTITQDTTQSRDDVIHRPWVKGSVFGGSEAGHVRGNTLVTIKGGQIGAGATANGDARYEDDQFIDPVITAITNANALSATVRWDFGEVVNEDTIYAPFDLVLLKQGIQPSDGKSWFGNVFGGGSGWFPYVENPGTPNAHCSWNPLCGKVWGNTHVVVEGGHILNNVYGGNESTDIGGKTLVEIKGGTVGVPRTKQQIIGMPTLGYVFGGGCGDPRTVFDTINNVDSTKVVVTGGTIYGSVYGGAEDGHVLGDVRVSVSGEAITSNGVTTNSTIIGCKGLSTADGNIFGGGRNYLGSLNYHGNNKKAGRVEGNIFINLTGGHLQGSVFGGGRMALSGVNANGEFPTSNWDITKHGNVAINVSGTTSGTGNNTVYSTVIGNADNDGLDLLTLNDESVGDIFGSGKGDTRDYDDILAGRVTNTTINVTGSPRIYGAVFGGGEMASIGWWDETTGTYYDDTGLATVTIGSLDDNGVPTDDNPVIGTYLELDADYALGNHSQWTMYDSVGHIFHTCTGNVFGGCQGDVDVEGWVLSDPNTLNNWPYMGRSREAVVNIYGGTIMAEVYGGSEQGTVTGDTHVTVKGGTIGTDEVPTSLSPRGFFGSVVGAGYGSDDVDENSVVIDAAETRVDEVAGRVYGDVRTDMLGGTVVGDVFGGAAFAYVGDETNSNKGNVKVYIGETSQMDNPDKGPTILGNVFGANYETGTPFGNVEVHVYSTRHNHSTNLNVDNCYPHDVPSTPDSLEYLHYNEANFAIHAVYGGGDRSHYTPLAGKTATVHVYDCKENTIYEVYGGGNAADIGPSTTGTSVNTYLIIDGGHFNQVFGGGNGIAEGAAANIHGSANTTINGGLIHELFGGSNAHGLIDEVNLTLNEESGCKLLVGDGFGGGNSSDIIADVTTTVKCGEGAYANFYGGSRLGSIYGNLTVNVMGGTFTNFFAGSKGQLANPYASPPIPEYSADIRKITQEFATDHNLPDSLVGHGGNVTLNIYGGKITNAFGGSDVLSQIDSLIMVNVIDTVDVCNLELTNLYGAGRYTTYEPLKKNNKIINSPIVNVIHGDVLGTVYGGGQGATATTVANPEVHIGYVAGNHIMDSLKTIYQNAPWNPINFDNAKAYVAKDVFGGGHEAGIGDKTDNSKRCNTSVTIGKPNTEVGGSVFGGGFGKILAEGEHMHPADSIYGLVFGNDTVRILAGHVKGHVYGGGAEAPVEYNTYVELTGGRVGTLATYTSNPDSIVPAGVPYKVLTGGRVFGGGRGFNPASDPEVAAADTITYSKYANFGHVKGNTYIYVSDTAKIHDCVFGGGALASVGSGRVTEKTSGVTTVVISGGEIGPLDGTGLNAYVYGGGRGEAEDDNDKFKDYANVDSASVIVCDSAIIYGSIFGGGADGHVLGDATIQMKKSLANNPVHEEIPVVGTNGKTSWDGNIFGGGRNFNYTNIRAGRVGGNIQIDMSDGLLKGNMYGGGRMGLTGMRYDDNNPIFCDTLPGPDHGVVTINISGGTVGSAVDTVTIGNVFGGGKGIVETGPGPLPATAMYSEKLGRIKESNVNISGNARIHGSVYGGGELAFTMKDANVTVMGGLIGSEVPREDDPDKTRYNGCVYGGGKGYTGYYVLWMPRPGRVEGKTTVNIEGGQVLEDVFGGGEIASVVGNAHVNISGGQIGVEQKGQVEVVGGSVYGGGLGRPGIDYIDHANVDSTFVNISDNAYIVNSVFGGGNDGHVLKSTSVNMTGGTVGKRINLVEMITDSLESRYTNIYTGNVLGGGRGTTPIDDEGNFDSDDITGRVYGNAHVTIKGGTVRHGVYGGGGLSSVGTYTLSNGLPVFTTGTGKIYVTIDSVALIGPTKQDMTWPSKDTELAKAAQLLNTTFNLPADSAKYVDFAFKFLGGNDGNVWGAGCGLAGEANLTYCDSAFLNVSGDAQIVGSVFGGGDNGHVKSATKVNISGGTIGAFPLHGSGAYTVPDGVYKDVVIHLAEKESETAEDEYGAGRYVFRGNVYGGGKGTDTITDVSSLYTYSPTAGRVYGNTNVTVSDSAVIYNRVYGGGSLASVGTFDYAKNTSAMEDWSLGDSIQRIRYHYLNNKLTGITNITVKGGIIGSDGLNNGDVVGGGRGMAGNPHGCDTITPVDNADQMVRLAYVGGTNVTIAKDGDKEAPHILSSVYGGSINGHVYGDTYVTMSDGKVGYTYTDGPNGDTLRVRGATHSNVFGGGGGTSRYWGNDGQHLSITSGRVYGNTNVEISGGQVYHNVYGGGPIASIGTYDLRKGHDAAVPNTGLATVTITGGTIGLNSFDPSVNNAANGLYDGNNNGMVFGSGRGEIDSIGAYFDSLSFAIRTNVTIGKDNGDGPTIKGSVYGSGENGHVYLKSNVNVKGGTIGCPPAEFAKYASDSTTYAKQLENFKFRGNVYGAGCGTDQYISHIEHPGETNADTTWAYNPQSGIVWGDAEVNISGGYISRNVYGAGAMASVGFVPDSLYIKHDNPATQLALSWPYKIKDYLLGGQTKVKVTGGHIGTVAAQMASGDVYGSARGEAGDRYEFGKLASARETQVVVNYTTPGTTLADGSQCIVGSVYGSGENGYVYENTYDTITSGLIGGSVFGGGKGTDMYQDTLWVISYNSSGQPVDTTTVDTLVHSITAGKVYGNTHVTINGGTIMHNVFGGGNLASVGKGNYWGYGEMGTTPCTYNDTLGGVCTVTIKGGTIGVAEWGNNGFVFGCSKGLTFPTNNSSPRYNYTRDFFVGYANKTMVIIGSDDAAPRMYGSVFGGGEDGHIRFGTEVVVNSGDIGVPYSGDGTDINTDRWKLQGNVYGAGQGIHTIPDTTIYCNSAGSVTLTTKVTVNGGTIHRNVYGGGSMATVGPPPTGYNPGESTTEVSILGGTIGDESAAALGYGGFVFGGARGALLDTIQHTNWAQLGNVKTTKVTVGGGTSEAKVLSSVYGGAEMGRVQGDASVYIKNNATIGAQSETLNLRRGNVFGGGSGNDSIRYAANAQHSDTIVFMRDAGRVSGNTRVEMTGGTVYGNVYGANEMTDVLGHASVIIDGGHVGWVRDSAQFAQRPYYGYVYGAGKGHGSSRFNTWTNVDSTYIKINSGNVHGSVFGGGEEGHVLRHTHVVVKGGTIGSVGSSRYDGNVFGAGRGRNPEALTAGSIGGNTHVDIEDGAIRGSVFGGGYNGSVGIYLVPNTHEHYGDTVAGPEHGYTHVHVTGGTIGHETHSEIGGNVYGGGRGMAGPPNSTAQRVAKVKETCVEISESDTTQTFIMGSVFGSGEDGHVLKDTYVNVYDGQIGGHEYGGSYTPCDDPYHGNVYGGGRGLHTYTNAQGQQEHSITAGKVEGNTNVTIYGGRIIRNVYGGGNLSSVGNAEEDPDPETGEYSTGLATVTILGGTIGTTSVTSSNYMNFGNVFGSGHGGVGGDYTHLAFVKNTHVTVDSVAMVIGSVFGGGEDGHVRMNTRVDIKGGTIGHNDELALDGNVYGGGRDISDVLGATSASAGEVRGHTTVNIMRSDKRDESGNYYTPVIWDNVFGGGSTSMVDEYKVVNISAGTIKGNVFGGSRDIPHTRNNKAPRWVNMWGGTVEGNVYGFSHNSVDGDAAHDQAWASFINLSGGTVKGSVFGGGNYEPTTVDEDYGGAVKGSVGILIGKNAIESMYTSENTYRHLESGVVPMDSLVIMGSVYAGSEHTKDSTWSDYAVTGYSHIFIDGTGYNTTDTHKADYMNIGGGIFGSGTHCGAGKAGHDILVRNYGTRNNNATGQMESASRTLTTIQRGDIVMLDNVNVGLVGVEDISHATDTIYGVMKVDGGLYLTNATGIELKVKPGDGTATTPDKVAMMDSIKEVKSLHLKSGTSYENMNVANNSNWEWIGIKGDTPATASLYYKDNPSTALTYDQENVIIFNDTAKMVVRYNKGGQQEYGELQGFFRMLSPLSPYGTKTFAESRPKLTEENAGVTTEMNTGDGGFLSYVTTNNFFNELNDDGGDPLTNTKQYPYTNVIKVVTKDEVYEYREWVIRQFDGDKWYVDGRSSKRGGIGEDTKAPGRGLYPDIPKKSITRDVEAGGYYGIYAGTKTLDGALDVSFDQAKDAIYVVGPVNDSLEWGTMVSSAYDYKLNKKPSTAPLMLYRYPGGHVMSNGKLDGGPDYTGGGDYDKGPGANYGALVETFQMTGKPALTMNNVVVDGLYENVDGLDGHGTAIPASFNPANDTTPLIIAHAYSKLNLCDSTTLKNNYNGLNADVWFTDSDYSPYTSTGVSQYHGAAIFVDSTAMVNVSDTVLITGNKQYLKIGDVESDTACNVYLPTFNTKLYITNTLKPKVEIGITSPKRNKEDSYEYNTFSPIAEGTRSGSTEIGGHTYANAELDAVAAWNNNNFLDDQQWFFGNGRKNAYYDPLDYNGEQAYTLYFGWTWANVVRKAPVASGVGTNAFSVDNIDHPVDLAWLISKSLGMNGETANSFSGVTIQQTADLDMNQYVWVPIGKQGTGNQPFAGTYDGRGHLIKNLHVDYIGKGDHRYELLNYGLFGYVNGGTVKRAFVMSGEVEPKITVTLDDEDVFAVGGLVGCLDGATGIVCNSESALDVFAIKNDALGIVTGGLMGWLKAGELHSSMSMATITTYDENEGAVGGMVGKATGGKVTNTFVNADFALHKTGPYTGGLIGTNDGATVTNCYVNWTDLSDDEALRFKGIVNSVPNGSFGYCYARQDTKVTALGVEGKRFTPRIDADNLGYMYYDNVIVDGDDTDTTLVARLNINAKRLNKAANDSIYAHWARPGLAEINGDLPVLLLNEFDGGEVYQGTFRSVGSYANSTAKLQYGGPARDGNEVAYALKRTAEATAKDDAYKDCLFIYGDVTESIDLEGDEVSQKKVSIHEDASILDAGGLSDFANTYVGISFDNSCGHAYSTPAVNAGLWGLDAHLLPRDWHMFSTPLSNAPQGFNYQGHNDAPHYYGGDYDEDNWYHNPWLLDGNEYSWLRNSTLGSNECADGADKRYWMSDADGYFPTSRGDLFSNVLNLFIANTDECPADNKYRYPYGMDFYAWNEPKYHWINFKRNGSDHWHSDENAILGHDHLTYVTEIATNHTSETTNINESTLISGKGYMAAITKETFMQSHGYLNDDDQYIEVTKTGSSKLPGWNLVGNPFHGYLDFNEVAKLGSANLNALDVYDFDGEGEADPVPFYVVYNADKYETGKAETAYRYYPKGGSGGGDYANRFLHPHQGFYVKAKDNRPLTFTESMLTTRDVVDANGGGGFRDERPAYPLINLYLSSDQGCADVTVIELERPHWGGALKLKELRVGDGLFYAHHDGTYFAALFAEAGVDRIPLWFEAKADDIFTMKWNTANGEFQSMYLIDNITGIQYDMLRNDTYTFEGHKSDYPSRFLIVFNLTGVEENVDEPTVFAFHNGNEWIVTGDGLLQFIDVNGQVLWQDRVSGQSRVSLPWVADGPYLFRLTNSAETKVQKVIVTKY